MRLMCMYVCQSVRLDTSVKDAVASWNPAHWRKPTCKPVVDLMSAGILPGSLLTFVLLTHRIQLQDLVIFLSCNIQPDSKVNHHVQCVKGYHAHLLT